MTENKRFTISVSDDLKAKLDKLKQAKFYDQSRARMIDYLLRVAFAELEKEQGHEQKA